MRMLLLTAAYIRCTCPQLSMCDICTKWELGTWSIIFKHEPSSFPVVYELFHLTISAWDQDLTNDFHLELAKPNGMEHSPSQDHPTSNTSCQFEGFPKPHPGLVIFYDTPNSLKAIILTVILYYRERMQIKISQGKMTHEAESGRVPDTKLPLSSGCGPCQH